jgi:hypothetical protein
MPSKPARLFSALMIVTSLCSPALAGPDESGQPSQDQTPPEEPKCVVNNSDFTPNATFIMELTNTCEQRFRCTVRAYIINAAGLTRDESGADAGAGLEGHRGAQGSHRQAEGKLRRSPLIAELRGALKSSPPPRHPPCLVLNSHAPAGGFE